MSLSPPVKLPLHQEITLLALNDEKGTFQCGMIAHAIAGAALSELLLQQRLEISDDKKQLVSIVKAGSTGDDVLDEIIEKIEKSKRPKSLQHWVYTAASISKLQKRIAQQLCEKKILRQDEKQVLWFFTRNVFPEINSSFEKSIKDRMAKLMFGQTAKHDERTTVLIALAYHTSLLKCNFEKDRLKRNKDRVKKVASCDMYAARATKSAIEAMQASIAVIGAMTAVQASN